MRRILLFFGLLAAFGLQAQPNTDVFLAEIDLQKPQLGIEPVQNISNNPGYDNQPAFLNGQSLYFVKNRNGQTDIVQFNTDTKKTDWKHPATSGGEYSPVAIPGTGDIAAVRLDTNGRQRLYHYDIASGNSTTIHDQLQVAYYAFYDEETILATVLATDGLDLTRINLKTQQVDTLVPKAGRSIHKIPGRAAMSYTVENSEGNMEVFQLDMNTLESYFITQLPVGIQDHIWVSDSEMLLGSNQKLYRYDLFDDKGWQEVADLSNYPFQNITRMAIAPDRSRLAFVAEPMMPAAETIVDAHISPYNQKDITNFVNAFAEDVVVAIFPQDTLYTSRAELKKRYATHFKKAPKMRVSVEDRIVIDRYVIDAEKVETATTEMRQVTLYKTTADAIQLMMFLPEETTDENPIQIVDQQLAAYNARDIDAFMDTYSENIRLVSFPGQEQSGGREGMRRGYAAFFDQAPDLHCTILKRIVIGNKVIDKERVTANGRSFEAVAIYEVSNGLIERVTFLR